MVWYDVSAEFLIHLLARACNLCVHTKSQGRTKGRRVVDQFSPSPPLIRNLIIISSVRLHITESDSNFLFPAEKINFCNQLPVRVDMNRLTTFNFEWLGIGDLSKWVLLTWYWSRSYASMCPSLMAQPSDLSEKKPFRQQNVVQRRGRFKQHRCFINAIGEWWINGTALFCRFDIAPCPTFYLNQNASLSKSSAREYKLTFLAFLLLWGWGKEIYCLQILL